MFPGLRKEISIVLHGPLTQKTKRSCVVVVPCKRIYNNYFGVVKCQRKKIKDEVIDLLTFFFLTERHVRTIKFTIAIGSELLEPRGKSGLRQSY